ncbi:MAG: NADH-quinone oxidoreductase subunit NuoH [Myxococcota bacterium]|jgi:NADH-quinone oxidoreductase subunit H|nr:NADH-quinone oxidoreductase subunit NuoH [Myxococcota bacterium]
MEALVQWIFANVAIPELFQPYVTAAIIGAGAGAIVTFAAIYAGIFIFFERRIGARMMSRVGPNRVGPQGVLQWLADAVKLIIKEDIIPDSADKPLFKLAPYLMAMGVFGGFAVLPFSHRVIGADLNIGLLYILAITSISVVGILMSGWASNSKWALFGGMRSAAQIVSYEIPTAMSLLPTVLLAGTMSTQGIIRAQAGEPWNWYVFHSPMMFILFFVYFISALAEGSRTPFDLPEAESELVSGYNTEYSGFRFAAYFLAEFANTWIAAAVGVIAFLGGWQIPFVSLEVLESATGLQAVGLELASLVVFVLKTLVLVFLIIQLRWTLPRIRVDQMMSLCWKYLVPTVFICTILMLGWMIILPWESMLALGIRVLMFLMGVGLLVAYVVRIRYNIVAAGDKVYAKWAV